MTAPDTADTATCRTCGAPVIWAVTHKGRRMPIDPQPRPDGNLIITSRINGTPRVHYNDPPDEDQQALQLVERDRYVSHFTTCPDRDEWRRR